MPKPDWSKRYCAGKGDHRRPEDEEKYRRNYDRIFRKPEPCCTRCRHFCHVSDWCEELDCAANPNGGLPCAGESYEQDEA